MTYLQLSNIGVKSYLETFFMLMLMILLLGSTSIPLGKSVLSGNFSFMFGKFYQFKEVVDKVDNSSAGGGQ